MRPDRETMGARVDRITTRPAPTRTNTPRPTSPRPRTGERRHSLYM